MGDSRGTFELPLEAPSPTNLNICLENHCCPPLRLSMILDASVFHLVPGPATFS